MKSFWKHVEIIRDGISLVFNIINTFQSHNGVENMFLKVIAKKKNISFMKGQHIRKYVFRVFGIEVKWILNFKSYIVFFCFLGSNWFMMTCLT